MRALPSAILVRALTLLLAGCMASDAGGASDALSGQKPDLVGEFEKYAVELADGSHQYGYALRLDSGERVELAFAREPTYESGQRLSLLGAFVKREASETVRLGAQRFVVSQSSTIEGGASSLGRADQALVAPPPVSVKTAVILLNFDDVDGPNLTAEEAKSQLQEVYEYYQEISYGSWTIKSDVFGPYQLPSLGECELDGMVARGKQAARDAGVDIDSYEHVGVKVPGGTPCPCGLAYVGTPPARGAIRNGTISLYNCGGANAFAHEMGHGIGLEHASTGNCNGVAYRPGLEGCTINEYGNRYNTMGGGLGHMTAYQKATMGWLNGCNIKRVTSDGTFDLAPIQLGLDDQTQGLQIDTGDTRSGGPLYFYVEYRNPDLAKFNAKNESNGKNREKGPGLHINVSRDFRSGAGEGKPILIDASNGLKGLPVDGSEEQQASGDPRMLAGDTFEHPNGNVKIEVLSIAEKVAKVKVSFPGGGTGTNECQPSEGPPPPPTVPEGSAALLFQDCDYGGNWSVALTEGEYTVSELTALGVVDNDASSMVLAPGYRAELFDAGDFSSQVVAVDASLACFVSRNLNDALSSIRIISTGEVPGDGDSDAGTALPGDGDTDPGDGDTTPGDGDSTSGDGDGDDHGDGDDDDGAEADDDRDDGDATGGGASGGCSVRSDSRGGSVALSMLLLLGLARLPMRRRKQR
jgi:MYXO-CTERM domain-containing protein